MSSSRNSLGQRAVVVGASIAGMLAARVIAAHVDEVVVLDRDEIGSEPAPRRMTPQSHHVHMLLKGGDNAINRLVPDFHAAIEAAGSLRVRGGLDFVGASELGVAPRVDSGTELHSQSRWTLEHCIRQQVLASTPNVELRTGITVRGLQYNAAENRVTGVVLDDGAAAKDAPSSHITADVVIDASGRGEAAMRWLSALGLALPDVEEVGVDFGYASAVIDIDSAQQRDWTGLAIGNLPRVGARGAVVLPIEKGLYMVSLGGRAGDYPPETVEEVLEFAKSLPHPLMYETLSRAKFVTPISRMIYPANRFRHYERLNDLPTGLLPIGDAVCSFNPTYGHGMSSAALQAEALFETLEARTPEQDLNALARLYLTRGAQAARLPWRQANYNDFLYPTTTGDRSMFSEEELNYRMQVAIASTKDAEIRRLANEVSQLLIPFERLLEPDVRALVAAAMAA